MSKRGYKKIKDKLYREIKRRIQAEARIEPAEAKAAFYEKRFREFGSNVETVDPGEGKAVVMEKWELHPQAWGKWAKFDNAIINLDNEEAIFQQIKEEIMRKIVGGLIEQNLVQIIRHDPDDSPLNRYGTYAAKLYIVPWEEMPHKRTLELKRYVENTLAFPKYGEEIKGRRLKAENYADPPDIPDGFIPEVKKRGQ